MALRSSTFCVTVFSWMMFFSTSSVRVGRFLRNRARLSCLATFAASDAAKRERVCLTFVTLQDVINVPFNLMPSQRVQTFYTKSNGITVSTMLNLYQSLQLLCSKTKTLINQNQNNRKETKYKIYCPDKSSCYLNQLGEDLNCQLYGILFWYPPLHKTPQKPPDPSL